MSLEEINAEIDFVRTERKAVAMDNVDVAEAMKAESLFFF